jgi:uncharacterized protein YuzE
MSTTEKTTLEKVQDDLHNWSPQGCTITAREATKLFKPLSDAELVTLHGKFGEHYAYWHQYAESELEADDDGEVANDENGDTVMAVEEMHDALKARSVISYELFVREEKAKKTRTLSLHKKTIPAKKKAA